VSITSHKGLGKGLDALFSGADMSRIGIPKEEVVQIELDKIIPNPDQPRRHFDETSLKELAVSINEFGVLQPLVVTKIEQNMYSIIAGERRWRASGIAGLKTVPCIIRSVTDLEKLELALIENVQREDLSPLEQAASVQRLHDQFSMSYEAISSKLGKAYSTVANLVRLLGLPENMQLALREQRISEGHARTLLSLQADKTNQQALLDLILTKHLSVRQAEQFVVATREQRPTKQKILSRTVSQTSETKKLSKHLGVKVEVAYMAKGGKITLRFTSEDDYNKLVNRLNKA
jgi:ParB family chromosome partitioning protein